jgi:hypothetical protein
MYEAVYNVQLTKEQLADLKQRFGIALEVAENFGGGDYNIGLLFAEREDDFLDWCEDNRVTAKLL